MIIMDKSPNLHNIPIIHIPTIQENCGRWGFGGSRERKNQFHLAEPHMPGLITLASMGIYNDSKIMNRTVPQNQTKNPNIVEV